MLERLFPKQIDNSFAGHGASLWLLGLFVAVKLLMSVNSMINTASIAAGPDGFPLDRYGAGGAAAVLMLFALNAYGQLILVLLSLVALVRYKAMVPLVYLLWLVDQAGRRILVESHALERAGSADAGFWINIGLLTLVAAGAALALLTSRRRSGTRSSGA